MIQKTGKQDCSHYRSYLLRLWQDESNAPWRASLDCILTAETIAFANPGELLDYLDKQTRLHPPDLLE